MPTIASITAGAGGMYCGSCLRDNTLARALLRLGVDIQLLPTYTPIRTDEPDVSADRVYYGGVNVFLEQYVPLIGRLPMAVDRWLARPGLLRWLTSGRMRTRGSGLGPLTVSMLAGEYGRQRKEVARLCHDLEKSVRPALVNFSNLLIAGAAPVIRRRLGVPILITLQGDDLFLDEMVEPYRSQALDRIARLAESIDGYITFSEYYADAMSAQLRLPRERFHIVPLGIDLAGYPDEPREPNYKPALIVGFFARHCAAKGFDVLVEAFIRLRSRPGMERVQLRSAGWLGADDEVFYTAQLDKLRQADLGLAYSYLGAVDRAHKIDFLQGLDVLCVPTTYREPKGLYVLESLATGTPVVVPEHGAFPELLASTEGGRLCAPHNADSVADALEHLLVDRDARVALGRKGQQRVRERHHADAMAEATLEVFRKFVPELGGDSRSEVGRGRPEIGNRIPDVR